MARDGFRRPLAHRDLPGQQGQLLLNRLEAGNGTAKLLSLGGILD